MKLSRQGENLEYLARTHQNLDSELRGLTSRAYLTPLEQERTRVLKKKKLIAKDRIRVLVTKARLDN